MSCEERGFIVTKNGQEIIKDTLETLDYSIDWTKRLARFGGTIVTSVWTVPTGITQASPSPSISNPFTTIFLSGGDGPVGTIYLIRNTITTNSPARTLTLSFRIRMVQA